ncbi:MAG TPA: hypothetical protein VI452_05550, partial [Marmoricola sp.]
MVRPSMRITRPGLVVPVGIDRAGDGRGPSKAEAAGRDWRRTSRGLYVPSHVDPSLPEQRIVEAAAVLPGRGGVTGWASLRWQGALWFDGAAPDGVELLPVDLVTGYADIRNQPGIVVSQERLNPREVVVVDGLPVTSAVRALSFVMRYARSVREAVVWMDMTAHFDLVSIEEAWCYVEEHPGWTGVPQMREALALADENCWSPWESRTRLVWRLDAGLPSPLCNRPIFDRSGRHVGTPDLLDPWAGVVVEYDGAPHLVGEQRKIDVLREEAYRRVGLEYLTVLSEHLRDRHGTAARMRDVRRRARWSPAAGRAWTLEPPPWWVM